MTVQSPEQLYQVFIEALIAGDIETLMTLSGPDVVLVARPGQPVKGTEQVHAALGELIALNGTLTMATPGIVQGRDLTFLAAQWPIDGTWPNGQPVSLSAVSADVVRRGADGA